MLKEHAKFVSRGLYVSDIVATIASFFAAFYIRASYLTHWDLVPIYPLERYYLLLVIIVAVWSFLFHTYGVYSSYRTIRFSREIASLWKAILIGGLTIATIAFVLKFHFISRTLILTFMLVNMSLIAVSRFLVRGLSWVVRKQGYNYRNVIIIGTDEPARDIARRISNYSHWGLRVTGFVTEDGESHQDLIDGYPVIGRLQDLETIVNREVVDEVIFAVSRQRLDRLEDTLLMLEDNGINARIMANIFPHIIAKLQLEELESIPLLTFTTTPTNEGALIVKRVFDVIIAFVSLVILFPLMAVTTFAVKLTSPGPVLFQQRRSGLHGRVFTMLKFRSMYQDAEERKKELEALNEMDGPVFKIKDDPRITPVGAFIRKTSIDELPQLWNVLKGDMSIVGPRPPIPDEVARYDRWQRRRLSMRPGLTCLWQISGRNRVRKFDDWVKLDLQYIDTWSLALDMRICLKTIPVVLFGRGAE